MTLWANVVAGFVTEIVVGDQSPGAGWTDCTNASPAVSVGAAFDGTNFTAAKPQQITATQFLNRIPPAVLPVLWSTPQTGILLLTLAAASMIDLTDPNVQAGINGLVPSILTSAQAAAILDH
jgi:hypothetical protein